MRAAEARAAEARAAERRWVRELAEGRTVRDLGTVITIRRESGQEQGR